eukprot:365112-Chlamydomonas_euryale.AAC.5
MSQQGCAHNFAAVRAVQARPQQADASPHEDEHTGTHPEAAFSAYSLHRTPSNDHHMEALLRYKSHMKRHDRLPWPYTPTTQHHERAGGVDLGLGMTWPPEGSHARSIGSCGPRRRTNVQSISVSRQVAKTN